MTPEEIKAIEEMAKVIETTEQIARDAHCGIPSPRMYAKDLYWKGYRKQNENGIELPCKLGDKVYQTDYVRIYESTINEIIITYNGMVFVTENIAFDEKAIGNGIFLTKAEAESKMKGADNEQN